MTDKTMDEAAPEAAEGAAAPPGGKKKLLIMAGAGLFLLLLIGGGAGAYFMGFFGGKKEEPKPVEQPVVQAAYLPLPDLLVNLSSAGRRNNFIKLKITLELGKPTDHDRVKAMTPRIIDNFQTYLRDLRVEDLQGAQGLLRLREELLLRINAAVAPAKVTDILFQEMLVQ